MSVERFQGKEDFSMEVKEAAVVLFTCQDFCPPCMMRVVNPYIKLL